MNIASRMWCRIEARLIDQWRCAYKLMTVWLAALMVLMSTAYEYMPVMQQYLPEGWVRWMAGAIIVARVIRQSRKVDP